MILGDLGYGWRTFIGFAEAIQAITASEGAKIWESAWAALGEAASRQAAHQRAADPVRRFIDLLAGAIVSGRAHVADLNGAAPLDARAWGWDEFWKGEGDAAEPVHRAKGNRIGWVDGENLYLEPEAVLAIVQELAGRQGESLPVGGRTLWKRLSERGLLASTDPTSETLLIRKTVEGARRRVLHIHARTVAPKESMYSQEPGQSGQPGQEGPGDPPAGAIGRVPGRVQDPDPATDPARENATKQGVSDQVAGLAGSPDGTYPSGNGTQAMPPGPGRVGSYNPATDPATKAGETEVQAEIGLPGDDGPVEKVRW